MDYSKAELDADGFVIPGSLTQQSIPSYDWLYGDKEPANPLDRKIRDMLRGLLDARENPEQSLEDHTALCHSTIETFLQEGITNRDMPQVMAGCLIKTAIHRIHSPTHKMDFHSLKKIISEKGFEDLTRHWLDIPNDVSGLFQVFTDIFHKHGWGESTFVSRGLALLADFDMSFSRDFAAILKETGMNPFERESLMFVGGKTGILSVDDKVDSIGSFFELFVNFNADRGEWVTVENLPQLIGEKKMDYVVSGNVLNSEPFGADEFADLFAACSNALKPGGKAIHVLGYGYAQMRSMKEYWSPGLFKLCGVKVKGSNGDNSQDGLNKPNFAVFEKINDASPTVEDLAAFFRKETGYVR